MAKNEVKKKYRPQDVINQSLVAFGQGAGCVRVSARACREFVSMMRQIEEARELHERWGEIGVQMLERMRAIGRVSASLLLKDGRVTIEKDDVQIAFRRVQMASKTGECDEASARQGQG